MARDGNHDRARSRGPPEGGALSHVRTCARQHARGKERRSRQRRRSGRHRLTANQSSWPMRLRSAGDTTGTERDTFDRSRQRNLTKGSVSLEAPPGFEPGMEVFADYPGLAMVLTRLACCSLLTLPATRYWGASGRKSDASSGSVSNP